MCAKPFSGVTARCHTARCHSAACANDEKDDDDVQDDDDDDGVADGLLLEARTQLVLTLKAGTSGQLKQATVRT